MLQGTPSLNKQYHNYQGRHEILGWSLIFGHHCGGLGNWPTMVWYSKWSKIVRSTVWRKTASFFVFYFFAHMLVKPGWMCFISGYIPGENDDPIQGYHGTLQDFGAFKASWWFLADHRHDSPASNGTCWPGHWWSEQSQQQGGFWSKNIQTYDNLTLVLRLCCFKFEALMRASNKKPRGHGSSKEYPRTAGKLWASRSECGGGGQDFDPLWSREHSKRYQYVYLYLNM